MKTITTEFLKVVRDRAREICFAKYNIDIDNVRINDDGSITCYYTPPSKYADEEWYDLTIEELQNADLDVLIVERKINEEVARKKREEQNRIDSEKRIERDKEQRLQTYLKLRKEFET